jgi:NAD(P)-dependent dehydrogenase (short-subunit alcohol dehydrogenase family)
MRQAIANPGPRDLLRLDGQSAVVTGGTDGIGLHTAAGLASLGARVIVTGRDPERGRSAIDQIRAGAGHDRVEFVQVDHLTVGANQRFAERLADTVDRLDILVNNVGRVFSARQETEDGYEATLALCFLGPAALTAAALPLLTARPGGRIVNMSSSAYKMWHQDPFQDVQSRRNYVGIQAHAHAKLLNLIWTFALAENLRRQQVAINATNPGAAWTPGTAQLTPQAVPAWRYIWPIVRFVQRRCSPAKASLAPLRLITSHQFSGLTGSYIEDGKIHRPEVAANAEHQRQAMDLAEDLVTRASAASQPNPGSRARTQPADE